MFCRERVLSLGIYNGLSLLLFTIALDRNFIWKLLDLVFFGVPFGEICETKCFYFYARVGARVIEHVLFFAHFSDSFNRNLVKDGIVGWN